MRNAMKIGWLGFGMGCILWAFPGGADSGYPSTVKGVLEQFLAADADAAGLSPQTWPEIARYTTWPSSPAWDSFVVIDHYTLGKTLEGSTRAQATVIYQTLGRLGEKFTSDPKPETVVFHLNKVNGQWKVDNPLPPHVSFAVMRKRLESANAANPKVKASNDEVLNQIETARRQQKP